MKIYTSLNAFAHQNHHPTIVTIGNFDGIHLGHRQLLAQLVMLGESFNMETLVISFTSHPKKILSPNTQSPKLLNDFKEKNDYIANLGVKHLLLIEFTKELAQISATDFVESILIKQLKVKHISIGYNNSFGKKKEGNLEWLKRQKFSTQLIIHEFKEHSIDNHKISSSNIREFLKEGNIEKANQLLGYKYKIEGEVIKGNGIGQKIGFPTANIRLKNIDKLVPKNGVYAVFIEMEGVQYQGVLNIGFKPTVTKSSEIEEEKAPQIEVHIFGKFSPLYQKKIVVFFHQFLREEKLFKNIEYLKKQIQRDIETTKNIFLDYEKNKK